MEVRIPVKKHFFTLAQSTFTNALPTDGARGSNEIKQFLFQPFMLNWICRGDADTHTGFNLTLP